MIQIVQATAQDVPGITAIYNDAVLNSTATWNDTPVDPANRAAWLIDKQAHGFPVLVVRQGGETVAYASFGAFRAFSGYRQTVENSIYVRADQRGAGIGAALLDALIDRATAMGKHVMVAAIGADNPASIRLHERAGFAEVGRMPQVGFKFGRWLDLVLMQRRLD